MSLSVCTPIYVASACARIYVCSYALPSPLSICPSIYVALSHASPCTWPYPLCVGVYPCLPKSECCFPIYLTPKSSTTNENVIGLHLFFHRPGVCFHGDYPFGSNPRTSFWLARTPACGSPYIPLHISQYIYRFCEMFIGLYSLMICSGRISIGILMYSYWINGVPK